MRTVLENLRELLPARLVEQLLAWLPHAVTAGLILAVAYLLWRLIARPLHLVLTRAKVDETAAAFLETVVRYALFILALVTALGELGINTASLLASLGVLGLTIGFAARDTLSNVISGLFIFWDRPFVINDLVEIDGRYGRVDQITLRSTRVVTPDGKMLAIPNSAVVNGTVTSYTNFPHLRLDIDVTVAATENLGRVRRLLLDLVAGGDTYMADPSPAVVVTALNDYNVALQLQVWLADEKAHVAERLALRERVFEALRGAGVDMPFETVQLAPIEITSHEARGSAALAPPAGGSRA